MSVAASHARGWIDDIRAGQRSVDCVFEGAHVALQVLTDQISTSHSLPAAAGVTVVFTRGLTFVYSPTALVGEIEHLRGVPHSGGFLLRLVDALAAGLGLSAVRVVDASHIEAKCRELAVPPVVEDENHTLSLLWFRAILSGQGWYESHGYRIEDDEKRGAYEAYVARMRSARLGDMVDVVARDGHVRAATLADRAQNQVRDIFVRLGTEFLEERRDAAFPEFIAWLWRTHCAYVAPLEHHLFSYAHGRQQDATMRSWQMDVSGELIKRFY